MSHNAEKDPSKKDYSTRPQKNIISPKINNGIRMGRRAAINTTAVISWI